MVRTAHYGFCPSAVRRDDVAVIATTAASGGFSSAAPRAERIRPRYARAAVGRLADSIRRLGPGAQVIDVDAGTGILTGQLARAKIACVALESSDAMLRQLRLALPDVPVALGSSHAVPFADATFGVCTSTGARRWPDPTQALAEAARVLEPGGWWCALDNVLDPGVTWVAELATLIDDGAGRRADSWSAAWQGTEAIESALKSAGCFGAVEVLRHAHPRVVEIETVVDRIRSSEQLAGVDAAARDEILAATHRLLATHGTAGRIEYPVETVLVRCQVVG